MSEMGDYLISGGAISCQQLAKDVYQSRDLSAPFYSPQTEYNGSSPILESSSLSRNTQSSLLDGEGNSFSGRYITIVAKLNPFQVRKCFLKPKRTREFSSEPLAEQILRKICGKRNLQDIMLLITPVNDSGIADRYKIHCFNFRNAKHFGVTNLTSRERELFEEYHSPENYTLVFSTRNIDLEDLAKNTPIKAEIFGTAKKRTKAVRRAWYQGNAVDLLYRSSMEVRVGVSPDRNSFGINSLRKPKIRVRLIQHPACDSIDHKGLFKLYGQKHWPNSNFAHCRRLDYPGFARRTFKRMIHYRHCVSSVSEKKSSSKESLHQRLRLEAKRLKSKKEGHKETDLIAEKKKLFLTRNAEKPKPIKMTIEMARKMRAQYDRKKAHLTGEREKERIKLARQTVLAHRNAKLETEDIAQSNYSEEQSSFVETSQQAAPYPFGRVVRGTSSETCSEDIKTRGPKISNSTSTSDSYQTSHSANILADQAGPKDILVSSEANEIHSMTDAQPDENTKMQLDQEEEAVVDPSIGLKRNMSTSAKNAFLRGEVATSSLKRSFFLFARVIDAINMEFYPHEEHLNKFFKFADFLSFKMYVRSEYNWPGCVSSSKEPRCRIECYTFDDQKDFVASIGLLSRQLKKFTELYPKVVNNMQYVNDAFALTSMPRTLTGCLKSLLHKNFYDLLAELTYEWVQEPCSVMKVARKLELEELNDQQERQSLDKFIQQF